ncbi:probable N-acetyltransferase HLS1-like [Typha latifolia]|uniref:probable N-acetyltransferase HLS1-like n=1 Tax=Typha latifolia TaxID=4733 RepID=UPI003C2E4D7E
MATEKSNEASLKLFTYKLGFVAFRTPAILVNPVGNHLIPISSSVEIKKVEISQAECLYRKYMSSTEFFPQDIDSVLRNKLSFGTWLAYPRGENWNLSSSSAMSDSPTPRSWAMLSVWNCTMVYKVKVVKAPWTCVAMRKLSNWIDKFFPWLRVPVVPNVFSTFGYYFMYGMQAEGPQAELLMSSLCLYVHNMARKSNDCEVIVAEVGGGDVIRSYIPHWKSFSFSEDIWCIKPLQIEKEKAFLDWTTSPPPPTIFFDPRDL